MTTTSCAVRARPTQPFTNAELVVARNADLTDVVGTFEYADVYDRVAEFRVDGLEPATPYSYAVAVDGELDLVRAGSFRTFPDDDQPLRLVFTSCARTGSNGQVFDAIRELDPDVYVCLGDFHYGDVFVDDVDDYRQVFDVQLTRPAQAALYRSTPIAYVWDDHDYGPNDSNRDAPGRASAMVAYREYVPHYDLAGPDSAIFQAFTIGTTRVVLTDARSATRSAERRRHADQVDARRRTTALAPGRARTQRTRSRSRRLGEPGAVGRPGRTRCRLLGRATTPNVG